MKRVIMASTRALIPCTTCGGRKLFWLGGRDYVECPECEARGEVPIVEERTAPPPTRVFLAKQGRV